MFRHSSFHHQVVYNQCLVKLHIYVLVTYLLHGVESFLRTNLFTANQEITHILWNPKVHYRIRKFPPLFTILSQLNPVHTPQKTSWNSILILSSHLRLGLPSGLFPSGFPTKTCKYVLQVAAVGNTVNKINNIFINHSSADYTSRLVWLTSL
jgi:hypothetical protein